MKCEHCGADVLGNGGCCTDCAKKSNAKPSNPSAFPVPNDVLGHPNPPPGECGWEFGMTLRDYFAAKAMAWIVADPNCLSSCEQTAECAYKYADAMLAERQKGNQ